MPSTTHPLKLISAPSVETVSVSVIGALASFSFAQAEGMLINGGYIIPWESGGGTYGMTREIPFTAPRGGFGLSRFKYKGMQLSEEPISAEQYKQLEDEFYEQLLKRNAG